MNDSLYMNPSQRTSLVKVRVSQSSTTSGHCFYLVGLKKEDRITPQYAVPQKEIRRCINKSESPQLNQISKEDPDRMEVAMGRLSYHIMTCIRRAGPTVYVGYFTLCGVELHISASTLVNPRHYGDYPKITTGELSEESRIALNQLSYDFR